MLDKQRKVTFSTKSTFEPQVKWNMKYIMRVLALLLSLCFISGCGSGSDDGTEVDLVSLNDIDLTGTWGFISERRTTKISTGEYLSSYFFTRTIIFDDNKDGVEYSYCWDYGEESSNGIKTDKSLYLSTRDETYKLQKDGTLQSIIYGEDEYEPGFTFETITTLSRISDETLLDNGTFILNGPISVEEYSHICVARQFSNIGTYRSSHLLTRYGDSVMELRLDMQGEVNAGQYQYEYRYSAGYKPLQLGVTSEASEFWAEVNSNTLSPGDVTVNISEISEARLMGTFDFIGQDDGSYSGEFEIVY